MLAPANEISSSSSDTATPRPNIGGPGLRQLTVDRLNLNAANTLDLRPHIGVCRARIEFEQIAQGLRPLHTVKIGQREIVEPEMLTVAM